MTRDELFKKSKAEGGMFIVIPSVVKLDTELPLSAQMLYGVITWRCNNYAYTWATNRELGEDLGVSPKRISALLALLEEHGHIEMEIEYKDGTKEIARRYIYPIMKSAKSMGKGGPPPKNEDTPPPRNEHTLPSGRGIPLPENAEVICNIKENKKYTPYSPPEGDAPPADSEAGDRHSALPNDRSGGLPAAQVDKPGRKTGRTRREKSTPDHDPESFEVFWTAYPRKDNRKKSIEAWDKLKPDKRLCRIMYDALKRQCRDPKWAEDDGRYIPMFSTWLNQRRWENQGVDFSLLQPIQPQSSGGWAPDPEVTL